MINVLFFASLREQLDCERLSLEYPADGMTVATLLAQLADQNGSVWAEALAQDNLIAAVNQDVASRETTIADGDEVAFFPPVTGG
ncbi:MAG: molybdopterin converting factor subunit 1 [Halioglobus sp.]